MGNVTNGIDANSWESCSSCYNNCFGEKARELSVVKNFADFEKWINNGILAGTCIESCNNRQQKRHNVDCQFNDFANLVQGLFMEQNQYSTATGRPGCVKSEIKQCFDYTTRDQVKTEVIASGDWDTFHCFWDVIPLPYRDGPMTAPVPFDPENPLGRPRDRVATGPNNECLQTDMM